MNPIPYNTYKYLYPPRPEHKISLPEIGKYDTGEFLAQPKYNGSCCNVFMDDSGFLKVMNRHTQDVTQHKIKKDEIDFAGAYRGEGFMVLCGELLNKNKLGEDGKPFNQKFIIWDILVYNGMYLVGSTILERMEILENLYPCNRMQVTPENWEAYQHICCTGIKGVYKAPVYLNGFGKIYKELIKTDLYEGLLLKRKDATLSFGYTEKNNVNWQIKLRKETKNCPI